MKSILAFLVVMSASIQSPAAAENWQPIMDSENGTRLIVDINSINVDEYAKDRFRIVALMRYVGQGETTNPFVTAIDAHECVTKGSGIMFNVYQNGDKQEYFWSMNGNRMYDGQGKFLCLFLQEALKQNKKDTKYM